MAARWDITVAAARILLSMLLSASIGALAAPDIQIDRSGDTFRIDARLRVDAHHHFAWEVLTDYNNLSRFVPGLKTSEIISAPGEALLLRQTGLSGLLFFSVPVEVIARIEELPLEAIRFRAIGGNVKSKSGEWRIEAQDDTTLLIYQANIAPGFWVPPLVGAAVMAEDISKKLLGVAQEIKRRSTRATPAQPGAARTRWSFPQ